MSTTKPKKAHAKTTANKHATPIKANPAGTKKADKSFLTDAEKLARLNDLHRKADDAFHAQTIAESKLDRANAQKYKAKDESQFVECSRLEFEAKQEVEAADRNFSSYSASFSVLRKTMKTVKFDTHAGEYFYAFDKSGKPQYRILLRDCREAVLTISADTPEAAIEKAIEQANAGQVRYSAIPLAAKNVSASA